MILIVSNAADVTADFFEERLQVALVDYARLNTEELDRLSLNFEVCGGLSGSFSIGSVEVPLHDVSAIYYRRPRPVLLEQISDSALRAWMQNEHRRAWGGILSAIDGTRWVNSPIAIGGASYKPEQLVRAARSGLRVPETLITSDPGAAERFCRNRDWRVVVKPVGHGEIRGDDPTADRVVYTNALDESHAELIQRVGSCPTLFQAHVSKALDIRATVVGDVCIAVALHSQDNTFSSIDCRRDNMRGMRYSNVELPISLVDRLVTLTRSYGLYYAAIDLALDRDGIYWFLELNPAGQWAWLEQEIGAPISDALIRCLVGAWG